MAVCKQMPLTLLCVEQGEYFHNNVGSALRLTQPTRLALDPPGLSGINAFHVSRLPRIP